MALPSRNEESSEVGLISPAVPCNEAPTPAAKTKIASKVGCGWRKRFVLATLRLLSLCAESIRESNAVEARVSVGAFCEPIKTYPTAYIGLVQCV